MSGARNRSVSADSLPRMKEGIRKRFVNSEVFLTNYANQRLNLMNDIWDCGIAG